MSYHLLCLWCRSATQNLRAATGDKNVRMACVEHDVLVEPAAEADR